MIAPSMMIMMVLPVLLLAVDRCRSGRRFTGTFYRHVKCAIRSSVA
jgi:hypothetical protein